MLSALLELTEILYTLAAGQDGNGDGEYAHSSFRLPVFHYIMIRTNTLYTHANILTQYSNGRKTEYSDESKSIA